MHINMKLIIFGFTFILWKYMILCQDIVYPNNEEISHFGGSEAPMSERHPVSIPERCPKNMLLYPGHGNISSWICDCRPRFLYFAPLDACHEAYTQGPCEPGNYAVLVKNEAIPKCVRNPCLKNGLVEYNGVCYPLRTAGGPCAPCGILGVNETTFEVECIPIHVAPFIIIDAPPRNTCPSGSRRSILGECKPVISNLGT